MKHLQKSLSLFLCIILCLSFFPFSAYAEESDVIEEEPAIQNDAVLEEQEEIPVVEEIVTDSENHSEGDSLTVEGEGSFDTSGEVVHSGNWGDLNWTMDDAGTLTISGTGPMNDFSISSAEAWRAYKTDIKKVIIASGVTSIGIIAFRDCNALNSVIIPDGVTEIGGASFKYCSSLESITIPDSVRSIGGDAFLSCNSLTSVTIPSSVTGLGGFPFAACSNLTSINVDPANPAFCDAQGVLYNKSMTIIEQVPGAWSGAYVIPYGVTAIQWGAFYGCKGLTRVSIPDSVTTIGKSAFYNCSSLTDVYYSGTQEEWQQITVGDYNELLTSATIHFLTEPEIIAFGTCGAQGDNLTWTLDNKGTLTISGTGAMQDYNWTGTTPPTRPWDDYQNSIIELVVNDGVTDLGVNAFAKMFELQSVMLPEGINNLPYGVFCDCRRLSHINFPSSLTTLDNECLFCTGIDTLLLPATVTTVEGHFYGGMLGAASKRFETAPDHPVFSAVDGVLFSKDLCTLVMYPCYDQTTYTVPDGTVKIREHAFAYNFSLETLSIPATVSSIGECAFLNNHGQTSALHDIYYGGTQEQWNQINIASGNELLTSATIHFEVINGLVQDDDGVFRYYENGAFVPKTGIVDYQGGSFFVADGVLCSDANGLAEFGGVWYFLSQGQIQKQYSGLALYSGEWFYIVNGILNNTKNGLIVYDGGQFLVAAGRICYDVSGLWLNSANIGGDNRWYFLSNGQVQTQYSGVVMYDGAFFVVENGALNENYNGIIKYDGKEFYVKNGQLTGETAFSDTIVDSGICGAQGDNLTWTLYDNGKIVIDGTGAMADYVRLQEGVLLQRPWEEYRESITELVVNDGVTALGMRAFERMTNLQDVVLPEGITYLPHKAFCSCRSLTDINFPASLELLFNECLWCTGIENLVIPTTVTKVEGHFYGGDLGAKSKRLETAPNHPVFSAVDGVLFTKDLSTLVMYPCSDQTVYTIPDGTTRIREHAFAFMNTLETLNIPTSVSIIGEYAFYGSGRSMLHDIYYSGSKEQWNQIEIGSNNEALSSATIHFLT